MTSVMIENIANASFTRTTKGWEIQNTKSDKYMFQLLSPTDVQIASHLRKSLQVVESADYSEVGDTNLWQLEVGAVDT